MERSRQNQLINSILTIGHGDLSAYTRAALPVEDPALLAHLIAYTAAHSKVRDVKVALPVLALHGPSDAELAENAVGHLLMLAPRDLRRAAIYHDQLKRQGWTTQNGGKLLRRGVGDYLRQRERHTAWVTRGAVQDHASLTWLYDHFHVKPAPHAQAILFDKARFAGTTIEAISKLRTMSPELQAATIQQVRIPFTVAVGAVSKATDPVILRALIDAMTGTEVVTNAKMLERWTANDAACRGAFEDALARATTSGKTETLKAQQAAAQVSAPLAARLEAVVEAQVARQVQPLDCNALIITDRSGSMHAAVEAGKRIAALVARRVTGRVKLVFVNTTPWEFDVTGQTLAQIQAQTRRVDAVGGTSLGCGLVYAAQQKFAAELVLVATDGAENTSPMFVDAYRHYERTLSLSPSLTVIRLPGEPDVLTPRIQAAGLPLTRYEFASEQVDGYNLPEIVNALRPTAYGLLTDVLATPLITVAEALLRNVKRYSR